MKLLYLVDFRSPIARNWISHFARNGHEIHVISSYPCQTENMPGLRSLHEVPIAFSSLGSLKFRAHNTPRSSSSDISIHQKIGHQKISRLIMHIRYLLGPVELYRHVRRVGEVIESIQPDLVHAMRIPFEGIVAALAVKQRAPLVVSVWGNDFTLLGRSYRLIRKQTVHCLKNADALHCDCLRDLHLANTWGYDSRKPATVLPGAGGIQKNIFYDGPSDPGVAALLNITPDTPVIINPRGFRNYVRNDTFFRAIPLILNQYPQAVFLCCSMKDNADFEKWVIRLDIGRSVRLLPPVSREQMATLFRLACITVSPSEHDGTPNTLLEAMACGCFPIVGDIESVREWITHQKNGLLCDPASPESLAGAVIQALKETGLRSRAREHNIKLIAERAEHGNVMHQAEQFCYRVVRESLIQRGRLAYAEVNCGMLS